MIGSNPVAIRIMTMNILNLVLVKHNGDADDADDGANRISKSVNIVENCQNVGQVMFPHHSAQVSQRSQVSRVARCMSSSKVLSD